MVRPDPFERCCVQSLIAISPRVIGFTDSMCLTVYLPVCSSFLVKTVVTSAGVSSERENVISEHDRESALKDLKRANKPLNSIVDNIVELVFKPGYLS